MVLWNSEFDGAFGSFSSFMKKVVRSIKKIQDETSDYSRKNKLPYAAHTLTYVLDNSLIILKNDHSNLL
ncbi:unnamed protein product [Rhizophagus irregularis]|uniref:Uncharacterized protein n=1 Tax=Rhizophagus irregularis TaxID=588596 RepID=A0A915Z2P9_9GLOM|nr:unnamed protein product [Rhizophagus irregularis]CAB5360214.1 unnamed protein product [Rhizophagus irregularis]